MRTQRTIQASCVAALVLSAAAAAAAQTLSREQQAEFLRTARVVDVKSTSKGVTRPLRVTLTDGTLTHDAQFQAVDEQRAVSMRTGPGGAPELNFRDSWRYNVAASRLAELLGIAEMIPVSVERRWKGRRGAFTWWVDNVLMDEEERRKTNTEAPDREEWNRQHSMMRVFTELVHDTDRNQGNILITKDWRLVMIDFTRAFRPWKQTRSPLPTLRRCDRKLLAAMRGLTKDGVQKTVRDYLSGAEVDGVMARRDLIVAHFDALVAQLGEAQVLY